MERTLVNTFLAVEVNEYHFAYDKKNALEGRLPVYAVGRIARVHLWRYPAKTMSDAGMVSDPIPEITYITDKINFYIPADMLPKGSSVGSFSLSTIAALLTKMLASTPITMIPPVPIEVNNVPPMMRPMYKKQIEEAQEAAQWEEFLK